MLFVIKIMIIYSLCWYYKLEWESRAHIYLSHQRMENRDVNNNKQSDQYLNQYPYFVWKYDINAYAT